MTLKTALGPLPMVNGTPKLDPPSVQGPAWVIDMSDPGAVSAAAKICAAGIRPGIMFKLTAEEFAAVQAGKIMRIL